ncbi:MAG TPA: VanZ family protein [Telluria sp.]|jgi:VanZ family protein
MQQFLFLLALDARLRPWRLRAAFCMYALILIAGSIPGARADIGQVAPGIILHSVAYGILTCLLFTGTVGSRSGRAVRAVLAIAAMGAADELLQSLLPYRTGAIGDWAVDVCAAIVCAALLRGLLPSPESHRPS